MNGQLTRRIPKNNVEIQENIWGSFKCTAIMDQINKTLLTDSTLKYHYKSDPKIQIGVLGMIDDTLAKYGNNSVRKNLIPNSFVEHTKIKITKNKKCFITQR